MCGAGTPQKARKASGFSLFVKRHYSRIKAGQSGGKHADVMRTLSAMWKEEKATASATRATAGVAV